MSIAISLVRGVKLSLLQLEKFGTYSELIFVKFVGSVSGFIFLHVDVQLLQDVPLLQRLSFLH